MFFFIVFWEIYCHVWLDNGFESEKNSWKSKNQQSYFLENIQPNVWDRQIVLQ